jgi:DNA transformation protein
MPAPKTKKKEDPTLALVLESLSELDGVRARPMFGGSGLYLKDDFFGMVWKGKAYFKVDDETRPQYERAGGKAFCVTMRGKKMTMQYYSVAQDSLEDHAALSKMAVRAARAYREGKKK